MINLLEIEWIPSWVSSFTTIMLIKSIFNSKILTFFFFARKVKTQVTPIIQYLPSFIYCRNDLQFRLLHHLRLYFYRLFFSLNFFWYVS